MAADSVGRAADPTARRVAVHPLADLVGDGEAMGDPVIPRVIHRVWMGAPMPPEFEGFGDEWRRLNPGWQVIDWCDDDLAEMAWDNADLIDRAPDLCPERYVPRFRSNLIRYELLHRYGGVYVDCDLRPLRPLDDLPGIDQVSVFAGWERQDEWIGNSIMGAEPAHPLIAALIDGAAESCATYGPERSPITTGPQYVTRTWADADDAGLVIYDEPIFYPRSWRTLHEPDQPSLDGAWTDHLWAALRRSVSVVIPYRTDHGGHRDRNLGYVLEHLRTEHPDWQVVVETEPAPVDPDAPFNRAALVRSGIARSFGDVLVIHDGDVWCPGLPDAVAQVRKGARWSLPHTTVHRLTEEATRDVLDGAPLTPDLPCDEKPYTGVLTGGCVVVARDVALAIPPDDRFVGWGGEDAAWGRALTTLAGGCWGSPEPLYHLWHPPQPRLSRSVGNEANEALLRRYIDATSDPDAMRALVAQHNGTEPSLVSPTGKWRHTSGRVRTVKPGARAEARLAADPAWEPIGAE